MQIKKSLQASVTCCNKDTWVCGASFKTWSNFLPLPRARYKTIPKFSKNLMHLHLLKFTCCKQDPHWRSSNLGQEFLKKTLLLHLDVGMEVRTTMRTFTWTKHPVQGGEDCPLCPATASTNPSKELSQRGDKGSICTPKLKDSQMDGNTGWKRRCSAS